MAIPFFHQLCTSLRINSLILFNLERDHISNPRASLEDNFSSELQLPLNVPTYFNWKMNPRNFSDQQIIYGAMLSYGAMKMHQKIFARPTPPPMRSPAPNQDFVIGDMVAPLAREVVEDGGAPPNAQNFVRIGDMMLPLAREVVEDGELVEDGGAPPNAQNFVRIGDIMLPFALPDADADAAN
ncbi:hypothetical protein P8452_12612 [Trifolium repens]|nr:hypothetical protein P8452_12612 [Trifolium repens]